MVVMIGKIGLASTIAVFGLIFICPPPSFPGQDKIKIVTTVFPLKEFAQAAGGDRVEVSLLLPPGTSIHNWQPRPGDIANLYSCQLIVYVGLGLEPWLNDLIASGLKNKPRLLEASSGLALLEDSEDHQEESLPDKKIRHTHQHFDPHIWLDLDIDIKIVNRLAEILTELDPEHRQYYKDNAERYTSKLKGLDEMYQSILTSCQERVLVVAGHAAFGYLARRYNLIQKALYGLNPDSQITPATMLEIIRFCRENKIESIFFENTVPRRLANTLARETGGRVYLLKTGHNLTREELAKKTSFLDIMKENLESLKNGLGCR